METTCPLVGEDVVVVVVVPSLTSAYCSPEDVVMNCNKSGDTATLLPGGTTAAAALAIFVGVEMRMVDNAVMAARGGEWRRMDRRVDDVVVEVVDTGDEFPTCHELQVRGRPQRRAASRRNIIIIERVVITTY
jgi:hypothetical protein